MEMYNRPTVRDSDALGDRMARQYCMTVDENVLYAKRNVVDSIWKEARIEGIGVTFPDTREIFEGRSVAGLSIDATIAIVNLKRAWQFLFDALSTPVDLSYVKQMNGIVGKDIVFDAGQLRMADVSIGGTAWKPGIPSPEASRAHIDEISASAPGIGRALRMFSYLCRAQLFNDGNKRTAQLVANSMMIADGCGVLAIPPECKRDFETELIAFYESGDDAALIEFLMERAVDGYDSAPR